MFWGVVSGVKIWPDDVMSATVCFRGGFGKFGGGNEGSDGTLQICIGF